MASQTIAGFAGSFILGHNILSHHLKVQYSVELRVRQCQNLFKQLGFSLQRPRKMPAGADPEKQEAFKKNDR